METGIRIFLLRTGLVLFSLSLFGGSVIAAEKDDEADKAVEQVIEPEIDRRDVAPPKIDAQDFEVSLFAGIMSVEDFGTNVVYGARIGYHITEKLFIEGVYGITDTDKTSFELLSGAATILKDDERDYTYWNVSFGYHILPGEAFWGKNHAFNNSLYLMAGAGNTQFAGDEFFTWNVGFGYRILLVDSIAMHLDFKDHMYDNDILGPEKTSHNLEGSLGLSYYF